MAQARKSYKAMKGLLRLKNMMNGQSVIRQTMNTMRNMQLLVRIQTQIHARRLQMMENQNIQQNQISWRSNKETVSSLSKWSTSNQVSINSVLDLVLINLFWKVTERWWNHTCHKNSQLNQLIRFDSPQLLTFIGQFHIYSTIKRPCDFTKRKS